MSNSGAPTGENGRKKLNVVESDQVEKLLEAYFEGLSKEGYGKIDIRTVAFDVPAENTKTIGGDDVERSSGLASVINVLSSKGVEMKLEDLMNALSKPIKLADLDKVKKKVAQLKKEKSEKSKTTTEKPTDKDKSER